MSDPTDRPAPVALTVSHEIIDYYEKQLGIDSSDGTIGSRIEELVALANRVVEIFGPMQEKGMNGHTFELLLKRAKHCLRGLAAPADSGGQADQPAEPSERELPTHWGHWVRNGEHYWVYGKGQMFHIQRLNVETGLPHEDTADFAITLNSAEMRGHWRPAVPDTDAALCWECPDCGYKMHRDHYDERLTDAQNCSACEILRLHSERDRLRERLEAVVLMAEASELYDIASVAKGC
jgi:hypothetical protein